VTLFEGHINPLLLSKLRSRKHDLTRFLEFCLLVNGPAMKN